MNRPSPFDGLRPPAPPPELKGRTLAAARRTALESPPAVPAPPVPRRPLWRLAWAASVVLLVLINLGLDHRDLGVPPSATEAHRQELPESAELEPLVGALAAPASRPAAMTLAQQRGSDLLALLEET